MYESGVLFTHLFLALQRGNDIRLCSGEAIQSRDLSPLSVDATCWAILNCLNSLTSSPVGVLLKHGMQPRGDCFVIRWFNAATHQL